MLKPTALVVLLGVLQLIAGSVGVLGGLAGITVFGRDPASFFGGAFALVLGSLSLIAGYGLLKLRPIGRTLQIVFSIVGLLGFPLWTIVSLVVLIYLFREGARVLFSGRRAEDLTPEELASLRQLRESKLPVIVFVLLALVPVFMIFFAIAIPNLLNAIDRGKQKRSIADMRAISSAVDIYHGYHGHYPRASDLESLTEAIAIPALPTQDGWSRPFRLLSEPDRYELRSLGKDGVAQSEIGGPQRRFDADIILRNGEFVQWPDGL